MAVRKVTHSKGTSYELTVVVHGKVIRRRHPTRKQALDEYSRLRQAGNDGTFIPAERSAVRFGEYAQSWLAGLQVRPSTLAQYGSNLRCHLLPAFGDSRLGRIDRPQVVAFVRHLTDSGLAPATTRGIVNLLRTILRAAVDDGRLAKSPCVRITLPELPPKQLAVFTDTQTAALIAAVRPEHRALLLLALATGLRQAELLGVTVDALDLDAGILRVDQQLLTPPGPGQPSLTRLLKTKASRRTLPLPEFAVQALREHLAAAAPSPTATGSTGATGDGATGDGAAHPGVGRADAGDRLVFVNPRGTGWRRGSFNDSVWKPLLRRAGLPTGYGMHALRHTYASSLIAQGLHPKVIQERLGHASIVETMDTYSHLFPQAHAETAAALDRHYAATLTPAPHLRAV